MAVVAHEADSLLTLRHALVMMRAQAVAVDAGGAAADLDEALAAIGAPAAAAEPPWTLHDQFPAELFDAAITLIERVARARLVDRDRLMDCWSCVRAARASWAFHANTGRQNMERGTRA